eukprot:gene6469-2843_t
MGIDGKADGRKIELKVQAADASAALERAQTELALAPGIDLIKPGSDGI